MGRTGVKYDPAALEVKENPYPYYAHLRANEPVYPIEELGWLAVSRYADVDFILRNPKLFSSEPMFQAFFGDLDPVPEAPSMIVCDPPVHTRLRKLVNKAFTPTLVRALEPRVRKITQDLLDDVAGHDMEFVRDIAHPLPVIVIAEILGVPAEDRPNFKRWSDDLVAVSNPPHSPEELQRLRTSMAEFRAYFEDAIEDRRTAPRDDLLTALVKAEEDAQMLTAGEILSTAVLLLFAGNETTTNLLGSMMLALLSHPDQFAAVRADPSLIPAVVEESLRYDGPIQGLPRQAKEDVELSDTKIPAGSMVLTLFASANHDETRFPDPDRFDITRSTRGHLAFGYGTHFCLGAPLARLESVVVLQEMLARYCSIQHADQPFERRLNAMILRGLDTLPLDVRDDTSSHRKTA